MQSKPSLSVSELNASFSERNKNIADSCSSPGDELTSFLSAAPLRTNGRRLSFRQKVKRCEGKIKDKLEPLVSGKIKSPLLAINILWSFITLVPPGNVQAWFKRKTVSDNGGKVHE